MATPADAYYGGTTYDVNTGLPQFYGKQLGAGQVGFGNADPAAAAGVSPVAPPAAGGTNPWANGVNPFANSGNDYINNVWNNTDEGTTGWGGLGGATFTNPQAWQNMQFDNPLSQ